MLCGQFLPPFSYHCSDSLQMLRHFFCFHLFYHSQCCSWANLLSPIGAGDKRFLSGLHYFLPTDDSRNRKPAETSSKINTIFFLSVISLTLFKKPFIGSW